MTTIVNAPAYGAPEVLELSDIELPTLAADSVRIAVKAAATNPMDYKIISGQFGSDESKLPLRLGAEVAGVITQVGADVEGFAVGDEVIAYPVTGGYASEVDAPASSVFVKPASLSWEQASGLLLVGVTASHMVEATGVSAGDRVIVHGASGSVGLIAVQLAKRRGATVVGTASESNQELVRSVGAEPVVYGDGLADRIREIFPDGADVALDTVGTDEAIDVSVELVADPARIASIASPRVLDVGGQLLGGAPRADPGREIRNAARATLVELAGEGSLEVVVGKTFPLTDAREALEFLRAGHPSGKVVLTP